MINVTHNTRLQINIKSTAQIINFKQVNMSNKYYLSPHHPGQRQCLSTSSSVTNQMHRQHAQTLTEMHSQC